MKVETIKPGDVLYDCHRQRAGNTAMGEMGVWTVRIISIDHETGKAEVSWNGNTPTTYFRHDLISLRRSPPEWIRSLFRGTRCYFCGARQEDGHKDGCRHPKAIRARQKAVAT